MRIALLPIKCALASDAPKIDGALTDAVWAGASVRDPNADTLQQRVSIKLVWAF